MLKAYLGEGTNQLKTLQLYLAELQQHFGASPQMVVFPTHLAT